MTSGGGVSVDIRLALEKLRADAAAAVQILGSNIKDPQLDVLLKVDKAQNLLASLQRDALQAKAAIATDQGESLALQKEAALLQEAVEHKQRLASIRDAFVNEEDIANATRLANELNQANNAKIESAFALPQAVPVDTSLLGKLNAQAAGFQESISKASQYTQALQVVSQQLGQAGAAINQFTNQARQASQEFDSARTAVETLGVNGEAAALALTNLSKEMDYNASSTELLKSAYDVYSARTESLTKGLTDSEVATKILSAATVGAIGGFSDTNTVADALTSTLNAYGESANQAASFVDKFSATQNAGKITIGQYAGQIGRLAPTAAQAGVSIDELNGFIATATVKGVPVESTFAGIQQAIAAILKPTEDATTAAAELGISFDAQTLRTKGLSGILGELNAKGKDSPDVLLKLFGSVEAVAAIAPAAGAGFKNLQQNIDLSVNSAGTAQQAYEKVASSTKGQLTQAMNEASNSLVSLGKGVDKAIVPLIAALSVLVRNFNELPEPIKEGVGTAIALTGGMLTLAGALAGVAAVLPILQAGFTAATGSAVAFGAALIPLAPLLIVIAAGVAITFAKFTADLAAANEALDASAISVGANTQNAIAASERTKAASDKLNQARREGRVITGQELQDAKRLDEANKFRLKGLEDDLKAAKALLAANDEQKRSKDALIATIERTKASLEGQNKALEAAINPTKKTTEAIREQGNALERLTQKQQESNDLLTSANKLKQAEIAESVAQGFITEEQGRQQNLDAEKAYLSERLSNNQAALLQLKDLEATTRDPQELAKVKAEVLKTEQSIADDRLSIAQRAVEARKAAEQDALKGIEEAYKTSEAAIAQSQNSRIVAIKQAQLAGTIGEKEAAAQIAQIQEDSVGQTIAAKQKELDAVRSLRDQGKLSAEEAAKQEAALIGQLGQLSVQRVDAELNAQRQLREQRLRDIEDANTAQEKAIANATSGQVADIKESQGSGVEAEKQAQREIQAITLEGIRETLEQKRNEYEQIAGLQAQGLLSEEDANKRRLALEGEINQARSQYADAEQARTKELKQAKIDAIQIQLDAEKNAADVQRGLIDREKQAIASSNSLLEARSGLLQAQTSLLQQRLGFALEDATAAGNSFRAEELRRKAIDEQIAAAEQQFQSERDQLDLKREQVALDLKSKAINAEISIQEAQIALVKAKINGASDEEIAGLEQILDLRKQQLGGIDDQVAAQNRLNQIEQQTLNVRQQTQAEALDRRRQKEFEAGGSVNYQASSASNSGIPRSVTELPRSRGVEAIPGIEGLLNAVNPNNSGTARLEKLNTVAQPSASTGLIADKAEVLTRLDRLIAAVQQGTSRPNLTISNANDLAMAGKIYADISRSKARAADQ